MSRVAKSRWVERTKQTMLFLAVVVCHFAAACLVSIVVGFVPEGMIGERLYAGTVLQPFFPFIACVAALLGFLVARFWPDGRAHWAWIPGLLWFAFGIYFDVLAGGGWRTASWGHQTPPFRYVLDNLLTSRCGDTECLYELLYTAPFVSSITYSLASWMTLKFTRASGKRNEQLPQPQ